MKFDSERLKSGGEGKGLAGVFSSRGLSVLPLSSPSSSSSQVVVQKERGRNVCWEEERERERERERRERGHSRENDLESEKEEKRRFRSGDRERRKEVQWQELDLVRRFEPDGDKEGSPCRLACVADSRSEVEMDPSIPVTTHILPKQTFEERQQQVLPLRVTTGHVAHKAPGA